MCIYPLRQAHLLLLCAHCIDDAVDVKGSCFYPAFGFCVLLRFARVPRGLRQVNGLRLFDRLVVLDLLLLVAKLFLLVSQFLQ